MESLSICAVKHPENGAHTAFAAAVTDSYDPNSLKPGSTDPRNTSSIRDRHPFFSKGFVMTGFFFGFVSINTACPQSIFSPATYAFVVPSPWRMESIFVTSSKDPSISIFIIKKY